MQGQKMVFTPGVIHDVVIRPLRKHLDERGWLCELYRQDELGNTPAPVMAYFSLTKPGITRGPHEHREQTDCFCFIGPANFKIRLWDARPDSPSYGIMQTLFAGVDAPLLVVVPPGIVHAYQNISVESGLVFNAPDRLYAGEGKQFPVDEIRHEDQAGSLYGMD